MIPSHTWFPTNLPERADWYVNFHAQADLTGTTLGLVPAEIDQIKDDKNMIVFLAATNVTLGAFDDSVRAYRKNVTEGDIDGTTPTFPATPTLGAPTAVPQGMFERLVDYVNRIKASASYTTAIGELYGIVPSTPESLAPGAVKPEIDLSAAAHGYLFSVVVSKREDSDAWQVFVKPGGKSEFQMVASATGKSTDIIFNPGGESPSPSQMEVYVQLRRNNANYGQPSEIGLVTVNP